jgi:trimethylamine--corrinoid protein Co-methyltransferase
MKNGFREGVVIKHPFRRLAPEEIEAVDKASCTILEEIGVLCYNEEAVDILGKGGCRVDRHDERSFKVRMPAAVVREAVGLAPSKITLGARDPKNSLVLDASVPRIYFGSGSEANIWLETDIENFRSEKDPERTKRIPVHRDTPGSVEKLARAARLAERLDNLDFFIRPLNIQDEDVTEDNHDVNKFYASLANMTKHVQAGVTNVKQLDNVLRMAEIMAGGREALRRNPIVSFITCVVKSPLQMVEDATRKLMEICRRDMPVVVSSSPQGGSTAPYDEPGMVAQINAEILCGVALSQMVKPGAAVLYGSVPIRARMDNLFDMYGAPEFNQYNIDCIQMARHYGLPCYSTAGVGDALHPGMQATVEKFFTHLPIAMAGAQYIHYAFGLLDRTNTFCPVQAVLDNQHIGMIKSFLASPEMSAGDVDAALSQIKKVMDTPQKMYARFVRKKIRSGRVYPHYPFEDRKGEDRVVEKALERMHALLSEPAAGLAPDVKDRIFSEIPGLLSRQRNI